MNKLLIPKHMKHVRIFSVHTFFTQSTHVHITQNNHFGVSRQFGKDNLTIVGEIGVLFRGLAGTNNYRFASR